MQKWYASRTIVRSLTIVGVMAGMLTMSGCGGDDDEAKFAQGNAAVPLNRDTVRAVDNQAFTLPAGAFPAGTALATQPTTVRFTNTAGTAAPTGTITAANGNTASGPVTFASCTFTIQQSNIPGITVGQTITVNPCQYNVLTGGLEATGQATTVQILLQLGQTPSAAVQAQVSIDPATGIVTVNNVNTGVAVVLVVTGTTGG